MRVDIFFLFGNAVILYNYKIRFSPLSLFDQFLDFSVQNPVLATIRDGSLVISRWGLSAEEEKILKRDGVMLAQQCGCS